MADDRPVVYDLESIAKVYKYVNELEDCYKKFTEVGIADMRACGIGGGPQGKKIETTCDLLAEKLGLIETVIKTNRENLNKIMEHIKGFNEQDVIDKVAALVNDVEKPDEVVVNTTY